MQHFDPAIPASTSANSLLWLFFVGSRRVVLSTSLCLGFGCVFLLLFSPMLATLLATSPWKMCWWCTWCGYVLTWFDSWNKDQAMFLSFSDPTSFEPHSCRTLIKDVGTPEKTYQWWCNSKKCFATCTDLEHLQGLGNIPRPCLEKGKVWRS